MNTLLSQMTTTTVLDSSQPSSLVSDIEEPSWTHGMKAGETVKSDREIEVYILISKVIYKVPVELFARTSSVLDGMFQVVKSPGAEGSSFHSPLDLEQWAPASLWHAYLDYVVPLHHSFGQSNSRRQNQQFWLDLLSFSNKFDVPRGVSEAKAALEAPTSDPLRPALQYNLGQLYGFSDWVLEASTRMATTHIRELTREDYVHLGADPLHILIQAQLRLIIHRERIAMGLPKRLMGLRHSLVCVQTRQAECTMAWFSVCTGIMGGLFDRRVPMTEEQLVNCISSRENEGEEMSHVTPECAGQIMAEFSMTFTGRDRMFIEGAIDKLCK